MDTLYSTDKDKKLGGTLEDTTYALNAILHQLDTRKTSAIAQFLIYSPENTALRTFEKEGQILPLGIRGEGLFRCLKNWAQHHSEKLEQLNEHLHIIDWFEGFTVPQNGFSEERHLHITDRYLHPAITYIDQKSANEGFLFLLFYFTLMLSDHTPQFFAIDNVDASLNPKLCEHLTEKIVHLAKTQNKQVILTTHNPAVLDGLDLHDDMQRLYVVSRNTKGETRLTRVSPPQVTDGEEPVRLSEAFLRGYIGGLPRHF